MLCQLNHRPDFGELRWGPDGPHLAGNCAAPSVVGMQSHSGLYDVWQWHLTSPFGFDNRCFVSQQLTEQHDLKLNDSLVSTQVADANKAPSRGHYRSGCCVACISQFHSDRTVSQLLFMRLIYLLADNPVGASVI